MAENICAKLGILPISLSEKKEEKESDLCNLISIQTLIIEILTVCDMGHF